MPQDREANPLSDVLRQTIIRSGLSFNALEKETGVLRQSLMKFVRGEQSLRLDMAGKVAAYFGLELRAKRKGR
jgi:plasmid maintenance system antidote protein VapI